MWTSQKMSLADAVCPPLSEAVIREEPEFDALISKTLEKGGAMVCLDAQFLLYAELQFSPSVSMLVFLCIIKDCIICPLSVLFKEGLSKISTRKLHVQVRNFRLFSRLKVINAIQIQLHLMIHLITFAQPFKRQDYSKKLFPLQHRPLSPKQSTLWHLL